VISAPMRPASRCTAIWVSVEVVVIRSSLLLGDCRST
jgi:hypothetical protein